MKKSILVALLFLIGIYGIAQRSNVANINTLALWELMPEKKKADSILLEVNKQYSEYYNKVNQEIQVMIVNYQNDTASSPAIKADQAVEIQNMQVRLEKFKKDAEADLAKRREELLAPVRKKMQDAIDKVAKQYKYDYVLDSSFGNILFTKNSADDLIGLVKKELGLK